jgi:DNA-directed RNA polymerase subunit RPC12/RpoP
MRAWDGGTLQAKSVTEPPLREEGELEGYCVKCRAKKEIKDAKQVTMKNGRPATEGQCPDCGTKIFKIGKAS